MDNEVVIKVDNVSKDFILPHERTGSVKGVFTSMFHKVSVKNETQHALQDISLEINKGEFFGIVGRNGSGKSTLLKILAGIYQPTKGRVSTVGKLVPFIELGVGFNPELTGRDNIYLNGAILGFSPKEVDGMYEDIIKFAELGRFMDQKLKNYSTGMQVRLAFSMAIRANADILLIDEVLAVGDADFQRKCFNYFRELKKQKKTVVFVSHDMSAVREYCDKAALIEKNSIVTIGPTGKVTQQYSELFLETDLSIGNKDETHNRWGNGFAIVSDIKTNVTQETITIEETITAKTDVEHLVAGFRIRDAASSEVLGTNTRVEQKQLPNLVKGEKVKLVWHYPNVLSDGRYSIDPAVLLSDGITVADWWDDAAQLVIKKPRRLPYDIDPGYQVDIKRV